MGIFLTLPCQHNASSINIPNHFSKIKKIPLKQTHNNIIIPKNEQYSLYTMNNLVSAEISQVVQILLIWLN